MWVLVPGLGASWLFVFALVGGFAGVLVDFG